MNSRGLSQAVALEPLIESFHLQAILASDLKRAKVTAEIVNERLCIPLVTTEALRECRLGDAEGMLQSKLVEVYGDESWQQWVSVKSEDSDFSFPNGESKSAHLLRLKNYLENFCRNHPSYLQIGVSTHGGSIRRIVHSCEGAPSEPVPLPNCAVYKIQFNHETLKWIFLGAADVLNA